MDRILLRNLRAYSDFANCVTNILHNQRQTIFFPGPGSSPEEHVGLGCHASVGHFNLLFYLSLSLVTLTFLKSSGCYGLTCVPLTPYVGTLLPSTSEFNYTW